MADVAGHPLYGKKKKRLEKCPNPLFLQWLREWRDEAAEKGAKSQYTYGKALKTLQKFPLELQTGKDCKILENFGDKICKMLDDKLAEHVATHGSTPPLTTVTMTTVSTDSKQEASRKASKKAGKKDGLRHEAVTARPAADRVPFQAWAGPQQAPIEAPGVPVLARARSQAHEMSDSDDGEQELQQPARKRQRSGREDYVPAYRSGPYAILLTLYRNMQQEDTRGFMTKAELIRDAQPLADKSFTFPDPNSRYTAWSSTGNLIKKGLVIKESSPARYSLTEAGCELAYRLELVARENEGGADLQQGAGPGLPGAGPNLAGAPRLPLPPSPPSRPQQRPQQVSPKRLDNNTAPSPDRKLQQLSPERTDYFTSPPGFPRLPSSPDLPDLPQDHEYGLAGNIDVPIGSHRRLKYWYVQEDGTETVIKDKAMVTVDEEIGVGFLIKCNYRALLQADVRYKLDTTRPVCDDFVYVYLSNHNTAEIAIPPEPLTDNQGKSEAKQSKPSKGSKSTAKTRNETTELPSLENGLSSSRTAFGQQRGGPVVLIDSEESSRESVSSLGHDGIRSGGGGASVNGSSDTVTGLSLLDRLSGRGISRTISGDSQADSKEDSQESSQASLQSLSSVSSISSVRTLPEPDYVLRPGNFDIILCVDNAEFYGASKGTSKNLLPDLIKNGVDCHLRKLHVGDLLWIAREKTAPIAGQLEQPQGRELVLNYIIERKRMDDLVSSCIDGRFKEQKFRLKQCGVQHPMYLIEDYGSMQHFSLPEATIRQAITNTQVIDGFQVKRTKDSKETVAFLTVFTRYLQSSFKHKTLFACGLDTLKESGTTNSIHDVEQRLPTFEEFNKSSVKSKALTVREMFGKQLIQLHGMSAEKARAVIERYPSPTHLMRAYDECRDKWTKETLLASIKCGKSARSLGQAQSKQISQLFNTHTALS